MRMVSSQFSFLVGLESLPLLSFSYSIISSSISVGSGNYENHFEYLMNYYLLLMTVSSLDEVDLMELQFSGPRHIFNVSAPDIGVML